MESNNHFKIEYPSEKKFGIFFSFVFLLVGSYLYYFENKLYFFIFLLSFILLVVSFLNSRFLRIPNILWMKLGLLLNSILSPIVMFCIFIITFYPIGFLLKVLKMDILKIKYNKKIKTYWIDRKDDIQSLKKLY